MNLTEIFVNKLAKDSKVVTIDSLFNEDIRISSDFRIL